ncbi:MAG TPA: YaiO family outer membrane beta-barrel protein, partial [Gemmatimonadaceae bacterium]|nr:YaiO family outer membrane beta-barrel protein [Gemmatimonadaceae bacterium]
IARVNRAERFGSSGGQVEVDAYPHIAQGVYAYLNLGYSSASLFPEWRSGGEIFTSLPSAYEASIGYRQLRFDGVPVTLFTGAVGKYSGNYWFSLRPYVREKDNGLSASASLTTRRYFADGDHYLGARVGFGSTPSDQLYQDQVSRVSSFSAAVQGSGDLVRSLLATWSLGYDREEITRGLVRNSVSLSAGIRASF